MALVPVIGEILFALSTCVVFLFSLAKIIGLIFGVGTSVFPYLEMFLIALSTGLACLIRWLCIMAYFKLFD
jgi:hypothetical protein